MIQATLSSGRVVTFRDLTARQQMNADKCAKGDFSQIPYYRVAAVIAKIDDTELAPARTDLDLDARVDMLTAAEFNELLNVYSENLQPQKTEIKNI